MVRRKKRFVPLYVRIGKESGKDSDACILLVALAAEESGEHLRELYFSDEVFEGLWQTSIMIQFF